MKHRSTYSFVFALFCGTFFLFITSEVNAQQTQVFAGGSVTSAVGSMSYSLGEVASESVGNSGVSGKFGVQQIREWCQRQEVAGTLNYANTVLTNMTLSSLGLSRQGQLMYQGNTSNGSSFVMPWVDRGKYRVQLSTNKPWGGVSATDALLISNHFSSGATALQGIYRKAADVDNNRVVNSLDALQVMQRFVSIRSSFASGNFVTSLDSFDVVEGIGSQNLFCTVLSTGDVNGSYIPNINVREHWTPFGAQGELSYDLEGEFETPVFVQNMCEPSAVSLEFRIPKGLSLIDVRVSDLLNPTALVIGKNDDIVRVAWYEPQAASLAPGDALLYMRVKGVVDGDWQYSSITEIADQGGNTFEQIALSMPRLAPRKDEFVAIVFPNPGSDVQYLHLSLPEAGVVHAEIFDHLGRDVKKYTWDVCPIGLCKLDLLLGDLETGNYTIRVKHVNLNGDQAQRIISFVRIG